MFSQLKEKFYSYFSESNLASVDKDALFTMCEPENSIENLYNGFKINFFLPIWVKQLLNLLAIKFHTKSFSFLGDMGDYIRLTDVPKR